MTSHIFTCKQFSISQKNAALKVGTDAVLLGALTHHSNAKTILDIGTGTGILSLFLAQKYPSAHITAIDIDNGAAIDAQYNFAESKWSGSLEYIHTSIQDFTLSAQQCFDIILCNPPFFHNSLLSERANKNLARHSHSLSPQTLMQSAKKLLHSQGILSIIIPYSDKTLYTSIAQDEGLYIQKEISIKPTISKHANRCILSFARDFFATIEIKTLIIRNDDSTYTSEYRDITKDYLL